MDQEQNLRLQELKASLLSSDKQMVLNALGKIKHDGMPQIIPDIFNLYLTDPEDDIRSEIYSILEGLQNQECTKNVVEALQKNSYGKHTAKLIACCWHSKLDFEPYITVFADFFVLGNYDVAIEAFTVIEESLANSPREISDKCKTYLLERKKEVASEKEPLFNELIKALSA